MTIAVFLSIRLGNAILECGAVAKPIQVLLRFSNLGATLGNICQE